MRIDGIPRDDKLSQSHDSIGDGSRDSKGFTDD